MALSRKGEEKSMTKTLIISILFVVLFLLLMYGVYLIYKIV